MFSVEYRIPGIGEFMKAETLGEVVSNMRINQRENSPATTDPCNRGTEGHQYSCSMLNHSHKDAMLTMTGECFAQKGDLEQLLHTEPWEYHQMLNPVYDDLVQQDLSFVLSREGSNEIVACALNFDLRDEPPLQNLSPNLECIINFLEDGEAPARVHLPEEVGTVIHSFMMATLVELGPAENVELIQRMENEILRIAARKDFKAVFTTNTSTLTQQVCDDLLSYKVLGDHQVNLWVAPDGSKPFGAALDSQRAVTSVKFI